MCNKALFFCQKAFGFFAMAVVLTFAINPIFAQEEVDTPDWIQVSDVVLNNWEVLYSPLEPLRMRMVPKTTSTNADVKQVFMAFPKASSAYDIAVERITSLFQSRNLPVEFTIVNFEGNPEAGSAMLDEIRRGSFDMVFSVGSTSTNFISANFSEENIPVVSVASKDPVLLGLVNDYESGSGTNIAYTSLNVQLNVQIAYLKRLRPDIKNVGILYARNNLSAYETQALPLKEAMEAEGVNVYEIVVEDQSNAKQELSEKITPVLAQFRESDPLYQNSVFWITGSTSVFNEIETINTYAQSVPTISVVTDVVKEGEDSATISIGVGFRSNADIAAFYAYDILTTGSDPGQFPVGIVSPPDISINFMVARKIGLTVPFSFVETASTIIGVDGKAKRKDGVVIADSGQ